MAVSNTKKPWTALEAVPGLAAVEAEWRATFGNEYESAKAFLRPNGKLSSSHPCTIQRGCGCDHDVVTHAPEDIVAVCRCGRGCETFPLKRSDIVVRELDRAALDAAIVETFKLIKELDSRTDLHGTTHVGVYSPFAGFRFPVYMTIQLEPADLGSVVDALTGRVDIPFILLAPSRGLCTAQTEQLLTNRNSAFIPLSENVAFAGNRKLRLLRSLDDILSPFRTANIPSPKDTGSMVFFPTPPDATWGNVSIRFKDGHTISIKVKSAGGVFNYTQMGMANKKNGDPTVQWELLRTFSDEHGVLDWSSNKADRRNQKRRENLAANLRDFFRIEGDPFRLTDDGKGWQALFLISPDE